MTDYPEYQHRYRSTRGCPALGYGPKAQIRVDACLHYIRGNHAPYFSVTADVYIPGRRDIEACGCLHDDILKFWPKLAPVIALHLSDDKGVPMHAEANGWYQLAGYYQTGGRYHAGNSQGNYPRLDGSVGPYGQTTEYRCPTPDECLQHFADHVRIPLDAARELAPYWRCPDDWHASRRWFGTWLAAQAPRFQAEADAAVELLDALNASQAQARAARESSQVIEKTGG